MIHLRRDTEDPSIYDQVVSQNEYNLPDSFAPDDVIIDLGANCGAFMYACAMRGAGAVMSVEPDIGNFAILARNAAKISRIFHPATMIPIHAAVWESVGMIPMAIRNAHSTASARLVGSGDSPAYLVDSITLPGLLSELKSKVRLLKMDIEGAELPVLDSVKELDCVQEIVGEIHYTIRFDDKPYPTDDWLMATMKRLGFDCVIEPNRFLDYGGVLGMWRGKRVGGSHL